MKIFWLTALLLCCVSVNAQDQAVIGNLGLGSAPQAGNLIDVFSLPVVPNTSINTARYRTKEIGSGDYLWKYVVAPNEHGQTRRNNIMSFGYNLSNEVSGEPSIAFSWESRYRTAQGVDQSEFHFDTQAAGFNSRPFSIDLFHSTGATQVGFNTNTVYFADAPTSNIWLRMQSASAGGEIYITRDSKIRFDGGNKWLIQKVGSVNPLGMTGRTVHINSGGETNEEVNLFHNSNIGSGGSFKLSFGGYAGVTRSIAWQNGRFEYQDGMGNYHPFDSELPPNYTTGQVSRTLSGTVGATIEVGDLVVSSSTASFEIDTWDGYPQQAKHFIVTTNFDDFLTGWKEILPVSQSGPRAAFPDEYAVDISVVSQTCIKIRLRRTVAGNSNTINASVRMPGIAGAAFNAQTNVGSDLSVVPIFRGTPWTAYNGRMVIGQSDTEPSALLALSSTNKGFLPPRMTQTERDAINNPAEFLMVGNTSTGKINVYIGGQWKALAFE